MLDVRRHVESFLEHWFSNFWKPRPSFGNDTSTYIGVQFLIQRHGEQEQDDALPALRFQPLSQGARGGY